MSEKQKSRYEIDLGPGTIKMIDECNTAAEEAVKSANVENLKAVYEKMRGELISIHKAFGTLTALYAGETNGATTLESDSAILAMKEVSLAAIRLASLRFSSAIKEAKR